MASGVGTPHGKPRAGASPTAAVWAERQHRAASREGPRPRGALARQPHPVTVLTPRRVQPRAQGRSRRRVPGHLSHRKGTRRRVKVVVNV